MGFEKRQRAVPAEQGVFAADGLPDQQAVEWMAVIRDVIPLFLSEVLCDLRVSILSFKGNFDAPALESRER